MKDFGSPKKSVGSNTPIKAELPFPVTKPSGEPWERETTPEQRLEHFMNCRSCQSHAAAHVILEGP